MLRNLKRNFQPFRRMSIPFSHPCARIIAVKREVLPIEGSSVNSRNANCASSRRGLRSTESDSRHGYPPSRPARFKDIRGLDFGGGGKKVLIEGRVSVMLRREVARPVRSEEAMCSRSDS